MSRQLIDCFQFDGYVSPAFVPSTSSDRTDGTGLGDAFQSRGAYRQVKSRDLTANDLGATQLKNIAEPIRVYSLEVGRPAQAKQLSGSIPPRLSIVVLPFANLGGDPKQEYFR